MSNNTIDTRYTKQNKDHIQSSICPAVEMINNLVRVVGLLLALSFISAATAESGEAQICPAPKNSSANKDLNDPPFQHLPFTNKWIHQAKVKKKRKSVSHTTVVNSDQLETKYLERIFLSIFPHDTREKLKEVCSMKGLNGKTKKKKKKNKKHLNNNDDNSDDDFILTIILSEKTEHYTDHLPHFSNHYLISTSIKLWSPIINPFGLHDSCKHVRYMYGFHTSTQTHNLFSDYQNLTWISQFIQHVDDLYGYNSAIRVRVNGTVLHSLTRGRHNATVVDTTTTTATTTDAADAEEQLDDNSRVLTDLNPSSTKKVVYFTMDNQRLPCDKIGNVIYNVILPHPHPWLLHPADAFTLSSKLLKLDNREVKKVNTSQPLNIMILDRKDSRYIGNVHEVSHFLRKDLHHQLKDTVTKPSNVHVHMTEDRSFDEQIRPFAFADVVIAIHGGGETNIAFMRPCSILIEVFPWKYTPFAFFHELAMNVGLIHEYWEAERPTTFPKFSNASAECRTVFFPLWSEYGLNTTHNELLTSDCQSSYECRKCARHVNDVNISVPMLQDKLSIALEKRNECVDRMKGLGVYQLV